MNDLKNLTAEKVIPVTPEKQEEMSWEPTTEPPVTPEKQEEEVLLWQPYQTPKYWAYHENYTSDWFDELQDETRAFQARCRAALPPVGLSSTALRLERVGYVENARAGTRRRLN